MARLLRQALFCLTLIGLLLMSSHASANLIGYWSFDGDNADDLSANANHGIAGGSLTFETDTPLGTGKSLRSHPGGGAANVLTVPTSASLESIDDSLSIAYWMNSNLGDNGNWVRIFQHGTEAGGQRTWTVNRYGSDNEVNVRVDTTAQHNQNIARGGPAPFDGTWHHVAFIASEGAWAKYEDGAQVDSGNYNHGDGLANTRPLYMFGRNGSGDYVGGLDDVAVYSHTISSADVQHLFAGGDPMALPPKPASRYEMNGNVNDSAGPYNGTEQGGPLSYVASPIGGQALDLNGSGQYVDLTTADNLGLGDNFTVSAWINPDVLGGDKSILGIDTGGGDRQLHLVLRGDRAHMGFYGNDQGGNRTIDTGRWQHVTWRFQNGQQAIFVDGVLDASSTGHANLIPDQPGAVKIGRWGGGNYFDGLIDNVNVVGRAMTNAEIRAEFMAGGTYIEDFEDTGGRLDNTRWYSGSGTNVIRPRTRDNPDGTYGLRTDGTNDQPGATLTTYGANHDAPTGIAWGKFFTVNDDTASLTLKIGGGSHAYDPNSRTNGGSGVALWDLDANQVIPGTFVTRSGHSDAYETASISLAGLGGKTVGLAVLDRQTGGWAWTAADSITSDPGAVSAVDGKHKVLFDYHFDRPGDWMGWTGDTGSFQIGQANTGSVGQHVNHAGTFGNDRGFISSTTAGQWDTPTGTVRSPDFTVQGDVIEFRIAGGNDSALEAIELVRAGDGAVLRSAAGLNQNEFHYEFWGIRDLVGTQAYLRVRDDNPGGWGHIEIDAIRMVELNSQTAAPMSAVAWGNAPVAHLVHSGDDLVVITSGSDIQGNSDNGGMAYLDQKVSGTFDAVAHVSFDGSIPDGWTKAGIMVRESEEANAANVFVLASGSQRANLQWRDSAGAGTGYDQAAGGNPSNNIWVKLQRWENGQVSAYWAPDSPTMPVDGWQRFGQDRPTSFDEGLLGLAATSHNTNSVVDARFRGFAVNQSMIIESFETYGDSNDAMRQRWYVSGGTSSLRLRTNDNPDGTYGLVSSGAGGSPNAPLNVYNSSHDSNTGMAWGSAFKVNDESASISLNVNGGGHALQPGRQRDGGTGAALWDLAANDFVPGSFTPSSTNNNYGQHAISLSGLQDRWVMPVLVDRQVGGWGWAGVDSITAPDGAVYVLPSYIPSYEVLLDYGFDNAGDFMGWQQVDGGGNPVAITDFQIGNSPGGLISRHINQKGVFTVGEGFVSSTTPTGGWDAPTGVLRSPEFAIDGDVLEFYLAGGNQDNLSFELWVDMADDDVFTLQRTTRHQADDTVFDYDFWMIRDLVGHDAYMQLVDNNPGGWGHIHLDAVRMVAFNAVPEPSSMVLAALGLVALLGYAGWRRRRTSRTA